MKTTIFFLSLSLLLAADFLRASDCFTTINRVIETPVETLSLSSESFYRLKSAFLHFKYSDFSSKSYKNLHSGLSPQSASLDLTHAIKNNILKESINSHDRRKKLYIFNKGFIFPDKIEIRESLRLRKASEHFQDRWFSSREYAESINIAFATAYNDLSKAVSGRQVEVKGKGHNTQYKFITEETENPATSPWRDFEKNVSSVIDRTFKRLSEAYEKLPEIFSSREYAELFKITQGPASNDLNKGHRAKIIDRVGRRGSIRYKYNRNAETFFQSEITSKSNIHNLGNTHFALDRLFLRLNGASKHFGNKVFTYREYQEFLDISSATASIDLRKAAAAGQLEIIEVNRIHYCSFILNVNSLRPHAVISPSSIDRLIKAVRYFRDRFIVKDYKNFLNISLGTARVDLEQALVNGILKIENPPNAGNTRYYKFDKDGIFIPTQVLNKLENASEHFNKHNFSIEEYETLVRVSKTTAFYELNKGIDLERVVFDESGFRFK